MPAPWEKYQQSAPAAEPSGGPWAKYQSAGPQSLAQSDPSEYDPQSPEFRAKYGAQGTTMQNVMAGAGKSVVDLGRGVRQLGAEGLDLVAPRQKTTQDLITGNDPSRGAALRAEQDQVNAQDADLMATGAGKAGYVGGALATTVIPASVLARGAQGANLTRTASAARAFANPLTYRAAIGAGAVQGALGPVGTDESRTKNVAIGAATGGVARGVTGAVGRLAQPLKKALSKEDAAAVQTLTKAGVPLDAAQRSGSKAAQVVKRAVADNPLTSPGQAAFVEKQQKAFTRAVLKTIGEDAETATEDVMGAAQSRIGQVFDDVATRNPVKYDGQLHQEIADISREANKDLVSQESGVITRQIDEIFTKAQQGGGAIDGKAYQNLRSSLGRISEQRTPLGHMAGKLRETLDGALQRSVSATDRAALKEARRQYRRMLQIEGAIDTEGGGRISAAKLANSLGTKSNRRASVYGRGDTELVRLAQAGKKLLPDKFPNSGTPARLAGQLLAPAALGLGAGAATGDTNTGLGTAAGAAGLLLGARAGMNNQLMAKYLAEGLQGGARNVLMAPGRAGLLNKAAVAGLPALQE